jgi:hypothetical protein
VYGDEDNQRHGTSSDRDKDEVLQRLDSQQLVREDFVPVLSSPRSLKVDDASSRALPRKAMEQRGQDHSSAASGRLTKEAKREKSRNISVDRKSAVSEWPRWAINLVQMKRFNLNTAHFQSGY